MVSYAGVRLRDRCNSIPSSHDLESVVPMRRRRQGINNLWWEDAVATFAMAEIIALSAFSVVLADLGLGKDIWALTPANITHIFKVSMTMLKKLPAYWLTQARYTTSTKIYT